MAKGKSRVVVVLSDLHCGSTVGLMPPVFEVLEGQTVTQNEWQQFLWICWEKFWDWTYKHIGDDPFTLILNGDLTEGVHHRTTEVISSKKTDHVQCAVDCLSPHVRRAAKTMIITGTECHTNELEHAIGACLGAARHPKTKRVARNKLVADMCGIRVHASHHIGTTSRPYLEASQLSINLGVERMECVRAGHTPPQVVLRAHRHKFGAFTDGDGLIVVTPPWQGLTRHGHKVVPAAVCQPGGVILDWRGKEDGELPSLHHKTYRPVEEQPEVL